MVQLNDDLVAVLDAEAARRRLSRSALIRELLEAALHDERERRIGQRIVEGYQRIPPGTPDEWGDLEAATDGARRDLLARLDAEERAAGLESW